MKKYFFTILFSLLLVSFQIEAAPTSVSPSSLPNWEGTSSTNSATDGGNTTIGDFNCDGVNDIIMAAPGYSSGKGRIYVQFGSASFTGSTTLSSANLDVTITGVTSYTDSIGKNIASMDIDDDGCDDIISFGGVDTDDIYVYLGDASWSGSYTNGSSVYSYMLSTDSTTGSYQYLHLLGPLDGDITGDGAADDLDNYLAMCSTSTDRCFLLPVMNLTGSDTIENLSSYQTKCVECESQITSGDIDGDGYDDLIVGDWGSYEYDNVSIFFGPLSSSTSSQTDGTLTPSTYFEAGSVSDEDIVIWDANTSHNDFGYSVSTSDIFGSGYDDLIIGAPYDDNGTHSYTEAGRYHIIAGESLKSIRDSISATNGIEICNDTSSTSPCSSIFSGTDVYSYADLDYIFYAGDADAGDIGYAYNGYTKGDFNGDGNVDLVLGGQNYYSGTAYGVTYIVYGGSFDSLIGDELTLGSSESGSDYYLMGASGDSLSTNVIAGDVTGDGYDDLIVTASGAVGGYGATYLWTGAATTTYYLDDDGDGYGDSGSSIQNTSTPSGYVTDNTDCDDTDATLTTATTYYTDSDGDGYGSSTSADLCTTSMPAGYAENSDDCDDANASLYTTTTYYQDNDGDGYGSTTSAELCVSSMPAGYADNSDDCDDTNSGISPVASELCSTSGVDDDCDGNTDEDDASDASTYYQDSDSDGYGNAASMTTSCTLPAGYSENDNDCDDTNSSVNPGTSESVAECDDGIDQNCDGTDLSCSSSDADGDGYTTDSGDCDDTNASINPGEDESCDGLDNNCDGTTDEATAIDATTWYLDNDGDSYGDASNSVSACAASDHYVDNDLDCDDTDATASPVGAEICGDSIDQNCDGADLECTGTGTDADSDGITVEAGDCDDDNNTVYPGAEELGDALDNDCDDSIDEGLMLVELTSLSESVEAGDTFRVDLTLQNNTGFSNFEVLVLVQKNSVNGTSSGGVATGPIYKFMWRNWGCGTDNENCDTVLDSVTSIANNGSERTLPLMVTMPADKESGKNYFIQVQFIDRATGEKIAQTKSLPILYSAMMATSSGTASGSVRPTIQVE